MSSAGMAQDEPVSTTRNSSTSAKSASMTVSSPDHASIRGDQEKDLVAEISPASLGHALSRKVTSVGTTGTNNPDFEVDWDEDDPMNPRNWPIWYKGLTIGFISWSTWV